MVENKGLTVNQVMNLTDIVEVTDKFFLSLMGGGSSLFYVGSVFYLLVREAMLYTWPGTSYKGAAFTILTQDGALEMASASRIKGGMGYKEKPKKFAWTLSESKWWYATDESQDSVSWGLGSTFKQAFEKGENNGVLPLGVIRIEITSREKLWGAQPVKAEGVVAPSVKGSSPWEKTVVKWDGNIRWATEADLKGLNIPEGLPKGWLHLKED